ncbi:Auxin-induced protein 5NG4 [Morus notabilis]|uniref:Auxin-induced protein 5NG4 n=1 Tax=Morus notabilis TaxID=981085 RepID=W9RVP1_9ROSA|nr:Auxin-induced protein 5NG4 [Morus notabilis]
MVNMGLTEKYFKWSQIVLAMLLVQVFATGMQLLSRVILVEGTFIFALMAYRHVVAAICVAPLAFYFERGQEKKFGWWVWFWLFINALTGITFAMGMFYYGLRDTTATYATNFLNLIPIVTFILSIITRIEKLKLHTRAGKMKTLGALLCVAGALTTSLYKGKEFYIGHHHIESHITVKTADAHSARGTFLLVGSCLSYSTWFIVQVKLQKVFPFKYWATMLTCIIASLQSLVIGLCLDRHKAAWKLGWNLQLVTIIYSYGSLFNTGVRLFERLRLHPGFRVRIPETATPLGATTFCLLLWVISKRGPTYPSMFNPLTLIFVALSEALVLGEAIRVGILLGTVFILLGLYSFLWGQRKEMKSLAQQRVEADEEQGKTNNEPAGSQLTATVVPSSSPTLDNNIGSDINAKDQAVHKSTV